MSALYYIPFPVRIIYSQVVVRLLVDDFVYWITFALFIWHKGIAIEKNGKKDFNPKLAVPSSAYPDTERAKCMYIFVGVKQFTLINNWYDFLMAIKT